jgi:hypothetical protein
MIERPSFIDVYLDSLFEMPITIGVVGFVIVPLVYLFFFRLSNPKQEKESGLEKNVKTNSYFIY